MRKCNNARRQHKYVGGVGREEEGQGEGVTGRSDGDEGSEGSWRWPGTVWLKRQCLV